MPNTYLGTCVNRMPSGNSGLTRSFISNDVDAHCTLRFERGIEFVAPPTYPGKFQIYSASFPGPENYPFELQSFHNPDWTTNTAVTEGA